MKRDEPGSLRVPPHSLEAEQSVLGGLLLDNDAWDRVGDLLDAGDFYRHEHRLIYGAVAALIDAGKPADVITVNAELSKRKTADEVGGLAYLNALAQSVPSAGHIRAYGRIVRERSEQRALIAAITSAQDVAWGDEGTPAEKKDRIASVLESVGQRREANEPRGIGELLVARIDHYSALAEGKTESGIPGGFVSLDKAMGGGLIRAGKLVVLGARPSAGKTSVAGQIAATVAGQGHTVLLLSQEMTGGELVDRFVANAGGISLGALASGQFGDDDWGRLSEATERLTRCPILIDDTPALTLHQVRAKARQVRRKHGLALVVLDYLQLCASPASGERRHHQIEAISRGLKQLAKELNVCVLLLSQLNRASTDRAGGGEPELTDLKESGAIEEDADVVLLLHPMGNEPDGSMLVLLKVAKNRQGRRGRIALSFNGKTQTWRESSSNVERRSSGGPA